jgi:bifunctional non-homologous end joining protein LigD
MASARPPQAFIEPMAATAVAELPRGPEWSYEIKLDGYRVIALKDGNHVRLVSRRNKDLTRDFP